MEIELTGARDGRRGNEVKLYECVEKIMKKNEKDNG
jgi:hypothetical protein